MEAEKKARSIRKRPIRRKSTRMPSGKSKKMRVQDRMSNTCGGRDGQRRVMRATKRMVMVAAVVAPLRSSPVMARRRM
jgi:hypothetical protein